MINEHFFASKPKIIINSNINDTLYNLRKKHALPSESEGVKSDALASKKLDMFDCIMIKTDIYLKCIVAV